MRYASKAPVRSASQGFTILEIMIATAILTLGLVGILALFPVAIHYGKQIVERSTAVVIAESVAEAIREGLRNQLRAVARQDGSVQYYFVFKHDGVVDPVPTRREQEAPNRDYYILLPRFLARERGIFSSRESSARASKTFVYPETDPNPNGGGNAASADDDGDDVTTRLLSGQTVNEILVEKTYRLGGALPKDDPELRGETILDDQKIEPLKQYSYAFEIQPSAQDANLDWSQERFQPANRLYRVRVLIYRGFFPPTDGRPVPTVFELDFEVAL